MNTTQCAQFEASLDQRPDGPWPEPAASHLHSCPQCRALCEELDAIRAAGRDLGANEPEPPAHLWALLRDQLDTEGLIRETKQPGWFSGWLGFSPRFAVGGACVALLAVAGSLVGFGSGSAPALQLNRVRLNVSITGRPLNADLNKTLDGDLERVVASLSQRNAPLAMSVRQNIGVVDNLIALCEKSVRENPDNPMAREYLYGAYEQKASLLAAAIDRSTLENR